jgi:hypothetical protein
MAAKRPSEGLRWRHQEPYAQSWIASSQGKIATAASPTRIGNGNIMINEPIIEIERACQECGIKLIFRMFPNSEPALVRPTDAAKCPYADETDQTSFFCPEVSYLRSIISADVSRKKT